METRTRYPHISGPAALAYTQSGQYILTTGADNLVRRIVVDSQDSQDILDLDFRGLCIATTGQIFAVCGESGVCELYDLENLRRKATLTRATLPIRWLSFSADGKWCGIVGDDVCRVVSTEDITNYINIEISNVKHLSFHPTQPLVVAVSSLDGTVRILDLSQPTLAVQKIGEIEMVLPMIRDLADERTTAGEWSPQGRCLAVQNKVFAIALVNSQDWLPAKFLTGHRNSILSLKFSPNGRYLASCGKDDLVLVWDLSTLAVVQEISVEHGISLSWHPHANQLSCMTHERKLHTFTNVVPQHLMAPFGGEFFDPLETSKVSQIARDHIDQSIAKADADFETLFVSENDDSFTNQPNPQPSKVSDDLELTESDELVSNLPTESRRRSAVDGASAYEPRSKRVRPDLGSRMLALQLPFQSGSTPWLNQRRLLCISAVGYVWSVRHSNEHHSVTISFFDQSLHREVHFQDDDLFDLAAVSPQACVLANSRSGKLAVRFHSSPTDNWAVNLDRKIDGGINCVALSSEVVVVFTKQGYMRAYTLYGSPLSVCRTGGSGGTVITCAAHENEVLSVYQTGTNAYHYSLEDVALNTFHQRRDALEIGPQQTVTSAFFAEDGEPCIMDSSGVLTTLAKARTMGQARWVPIFSAQQSSKDDEQLTRKYWPISVQDSKLLCIVLRGQQQYPSIPLNIVEEVDLAVPGLAKLETQYMVAKCQFQQIQDRAEYSMRLANEEEIEESVQNTLTDMALDMDKLLLRQFQAACSEKRASRGLQLVALVQRPESLVAAAKIATAYELTNLASRIAEIIN